MSHFDRAIRNELTRRIGHQSLPGFKITLQDGSIQHFAGSSGAGGNENDPLERPAFNIKVCTDAGMRALGSFDEYAVAEAYLNSDIDVEGDFYASLKLREAFTDYHPFYSLWRFIVPALIGQVRADKKYVPQHYDRGDEFFFGFLDRKFKMYSQALFRCEDEPLETAAANKMDYIWEVCRLGPAKTVLDVGAGWGSFARYAVPKGAHVCMLTISPRQHEYLQRWCQSHPSAAGSAAIYEDIYRYEADQEYDAIVILGVLEHLPNYPRLLKRLSELLKPDGRVYLDFSAGRAKYGGSTFAYRHIFVGNHACVVMGDFLSAVDASPFEIVAISNDRHSYFLTMKRWAENLEACGPELSRRFGESTYRLFRMYLWGGAYNLHERGDMESYRVVLQNSIGRSSSCLGLT